MIPVQELTMKHISLTFFMDTGIEQIETNIADRTTRRLSFYSKHFWPFRIKGCNGLGTTRDTFLQISFFQNNLNRLKAVDLSWFRTWMVRNEGNLRWPLDTCHRNNCLIMYSKIKKNFGRLDSRVVFTLDFWTSVRYALGREFEPRRRQTQAQHQCFIHNSVWFDTIICLSNLSCELWSGKLKIKEIYLKKKKKKESSLT